MLKLRYLVTGAAGFIGSSLVHKLSNFGNEILAIDNFSPYYSKQYKKIRVENLLFNENIKFVNCDLNDSQKMKSKIKKFEPDMVIHLAAQPGVRLPLNENYKYIESNIKAFDNLLNILSELKIHGFLYASSSSVYGDTMQFPLTEKSKELSPKSFYGITKLANELVINGMSKNLNFPARGLRFFTAYGPWGRPDMLYFKLIANSLNSQKTTIFGDGTNSRDFTFIDDLISSIIALSEDLSLREPGFSDIVNIGGGSTVSMNSLIEIVSNQINSKIQVEFKEKHEGDVNKTIADTDYLNKLIGFKPTTDVNQGIEQTVKWAIQSSIRSELIKWSNSVN
jgi:UDP-glucuronate 4-epimerase